MKLRWGEAFDGFVDRPLSLVLVDIWRDEGVVDFMPQGVLLFREALAAPNPDGLEGSERLALGVTHLGIVLVFNVPYALVDEKRGGHGDRSRLKFQEQ
jgi:hypothetical protein